MLNLFHPITSARNCASRLFKRNRTEHAAAVRQPAVEANCEESRKENSTVDDVESLVGQMLSDGRYALLLRPQISANLTSELYQKARDALENDMGLTPQGDVHLEPRE
jgi:hypothetical protein